MEAQAHVTVGVPVEVAFAYYSDQSVLQEWIPGGATLEFTPLTPPPKQVGSRYRWVYRSMGVTFTSIVEIKALELNRLSVKEQLVGDFESFHYEMHFTALDRDRTRVGMRTRTELPWGVFGKLAEPVARPRVEQDMRTGLGRFKNGVEARARLARLQSTQAAIA